MKHFMYIMYIMIVLVCFFYTPAYCADRYLQPLKQDGQEEVLAQGGSVLVSQKKHTVLMYQTSEATSGNRANFFIAFVNNGSKSVDVLFNHLRVTDQAGNFVRVIPKEELIANKRHTANWKGTLSATASFFRALDADRAGRTDIYTDTHDTHTYHVDTLSPHGMTCTQGIAQGSSSAHTVVHSELARQQALREVEQDAAESAQQIAGEYEYWEHGLSNYYFDSNTVFPNKTYAGNFQIDIPSKIEKNIECLVFNLYVENEVHTFYFYCGHQKKKWYQLW